MEHTKFGLIKKRGEIDGRHKVAVAAADEGHTDLQEHRQSACCSVVALRRKWLAVVRAF